MNDLADRVAELEARLQAVATRCGELARDICGDADCKSYEAEFLALALMCGSGGSGLVAIDRELLSRLEDWLAKALDHFEGAPPPSEILGKHLHADLLEVTNQAGIT